ncbi:uncharacterized protein LOC130782868 [Actinidia eriantha]|uniref:uncharacterized protein LOC130782868 n=1 Tax=Actinidia eriantha TaxID=165200 RepID=UPI00258D434A|nr:uncharacterized protein LOC130782868 [Actinidia eriantha]
MVMKEKDDDLALFLEMRSREKERSDFLLQSSDDFDDRLGFEQDSDPIFKITPTLPAHKTRADEFLNSENDKTDYDWLVKPPGAPLFPSLEMEPKKTSMSWIGISNGCRAAPKSTPDNNHAEPVLSTGSNPSIAANRRPSSSGGLTSTQNGRPTIPSTAKPSRPSSPRLRATLPTTAKPSRPSSPSLRATLPTTAKPSRPSTPNSRATLPTTTPTARATSRSTKPIAPPVRSLTPTRSIIRSSTPTRSITRSSTPTTRPSEPAASKPTSRSATPTRRQSTPHSIISTSDSTCHSSLTSSVPKTLKNVPSQGISKASVPERPASAPRGRPGAPSARPSSIEAKPNARPRRQSCSPSRGRAPNGGVHKSRSSVLAMSRAHATGCEEVSPVLIGTKMVERVVSMRKLVPPKEDDHISKHSSASLGKSLSSQETPGFGRTLSKKSFDMALRHMDIRRSIPGNLRPLVTSIPASAVYSVRSGSTKSMTVSLSDSPLATSSNASSEPSINNNAHYSESSEVNDDFGNNRGRYHPGLSHDVGSGRLVMPR